jgi:hypothetical protein
VDLAARHLGQDGCGFFARQLIPGEIKATTEGGVTALNDRCDERPDVGHGDLLQRVPACLGGIRPAGSRRLRLRSTFDREHSSPAGGAHQGIMVSEVTDCDFNALLTQSVSRRRGSISCQSPDSMASGQ